MSAAAAFLGLGMLVVGALLKARLTKKWAVYFIYPQVAVFPKLCPMCLSHDPEVVVEEESDKRRTKNYVVAQRLEWWKVKIPHCRKRNAKLERNKVIGLAVGAACAIAALIATPPQEPSLATFGYILFGYPAWVIATTVQKGIVCGQSKAALMMVRVRQPEYFNQLEMMNPLRVARNPLS
jgi:hypothetical protein